MQYHWVVCYDQDTNSFEIDWDMTYHALDGVMFDDTAAVLEAWFGPHDMSETQEIMYEEYSVYLEKALDNIDTM